MEESTGNPANPDPDERAVPPPRPVGAFEPFRHPLFVGCWWGSLLAHAAIWLQNITVPYLVFEMTGSTTWLGAAAVAGQAPALVASPLGGVLADRYSRRGLLIVTLVLKATVSFGFYTLWRRDALQLHAMLTLLVLSAVAHTVHLACSSAFVPQIVPRRILAAAVRLNSVQQNFSRAGGPAVAGWILAQYGAGAAFLTSAFAYLPFAAVLVVGRPRRVEPAPHEGTLRALRAGVGALLGSRALVIATLTSAVVSFFGAAVQSLTAGLASDVYGVDAQGFGWLVSSMGISCVVWGTVLALMGERVARSRIVLIGLFCYAAGTALAGATGIFAIGIVAFALMGVGHVFVYVSCATSMQLYLSDALRGRGTALYMTAVFVAIPAGAQLGGWLGDRIGLPAVLIGYGAAMGAYALLSAVALRGLADIDGDGSVGSGERRPAPGPAVSDARPAR